MSLLAQLSETAKVLNEASKLTEHGPLGIMLFVAAMGLACLVIYIIKSHEKQITEILDVQKAQQINFDRHIENLRADQKEQRELDRKALQELTTKLVEALDTK